MNRTEGVCLSPYGEDGAISVSMTVEIPWAARIGLGTWLSRSQWPTRRLLEVFTHTVCYAGRYRQVQVVTGMAKVRKLVGSQTHPNQPRQAEDGGTASLAGQQRYSLAGCS